MSKCIFDQTEKTFHHIEKYSSYKVKNKEILFGCKFVGGKKSSVKVNCLTDNMFHIQMNIDRDGFDKQTPMVVKHNWDKIPCKIRSSNRGVEIKTRMVTLYVNKDPWQISVHDKCIL